MLAGMTTGGPQVSQSVKAGGLESDSPTFYVKRRVSRFFDETLDDEARLDAAVELAKFANGWIKEASTPLPIEKFAEAEAISTAVGLLADHCDTHFTASSIGPFQASWLELVEADRSAQGAFGKQEYWRELLSRLDFLSSQGRFGDALALADREGPHAIENASTAWRVQLLCMRADCLRLKGNFKRALVDLRSAEEGSQAAGLWEQLQVAGVRIGVETDLGRLDRADAALSVASRIVDELGTHSSPLIQNRLWRMRTAHLLSVGREHEALRTARGRIEQHGEVLAKTTPGLRALDTLRYQAFRAAKACNWDSLLPEEQAYASIEAADYLRQHSYLDQFRKSAVAIDRIALLHARGRTDEALESLRALDWGRVANYSSPDTATSESPLLALRLAALRFQVTKDLGETRDLEAASTNLHRAYELLLEIWRSVALDSSGIGFLEFFERRRALHVVLESVLGPEDGAESRALSFVLAADSCSTIARRLGEDATTVDQVVELVSAADATLVYLVPTPEVTHRFIVTARGVVHQRLEGEAEFSENFRPVLRELRRRPSQNSAWPSMAIQPQLQWLSERLVPKTPTGKIFYAGLGAFGFAPIEVLPNSSGQPIGLSHVIARVPSVTALARWRAIDLARPAAETDSMSVFAVSGSGVDPASGKPMAPIPFGLPEYTALRSAVPGTMVSYNSGPGETAQEFLHAVKSGPDLFVAMTHGTPRSTSTESPGLLVRDDATVDGNGAPELAVLTAESLARSLRISTSDLPAVAVLAACGAGAGPRRLGDSGAGDFSGSLLAAGIPAVLVASEEVEVKAAIAYIQAFSGALIRDRLSVGEATLLSRQTVAARPSHDHPHFWASLQLHGWSDARLKR
jgi:CHAT domain-containing protein/tetratricopeptide (TPR) repeat protein